MAPVFAQATDGQAPRTEDFQTRINTVCFNKSFDKSESFVFKATALLETTHSTALRAWFLCQPVCFVHGLKIAFVETKHGYGTVFKT